MAVVFFDGFNFNQYESAGLDTNYWSWSNKGYGNSDQGRTNGCVWLPYRNENASLSDNAWIKLSNFSDPLATYSCLGIGFWVNQINGSAGLVAPVTSHSTYENLLSLTTNNGTLAVDITRNSDDYGFSLVVRENGTAINSYDIRSAPGNNFNVQRYNIGGDIGAFGYVNHGLYFDFFFDATNGSFSVRAAGANTLATPLYNYSGSATTTITSFSSVTEVKLYGSEYMGRYYSPFVRSYDDFYFTAGNSLSDVFLGPNTRIYRLQSNETLGFNWQQDLGGNDPNYAIQNNNGDNSYIRSNGTGQVAYYNFDNLPGGAPNNIAGMKLINVVRKSGNNNQSLVNTMASSSSDVGNIQNIGPTYTIDTESYKTKANTYLTNPITSSNWTASDINNMVLGVKNIT